MRHLLFVLFSAAAYSTTAQIHFSKVYSADPFNGASIDQSGGLVIVSDSGLHRMSALGDPWWTKEASATTWLKFNDVAVLGDSTYLVVGRALGSYGGFPTNDALVGFFDTTGAPIWSGLIGGTNVQEYTFATAEPSGTALLGGSWEGLAAAHGLVARASDAITPLYPSSASLTDGTPGAYILDAVPLANGDDLTCGVGLQHLFISRNALGTGATWCRTYTVNGTLNFTGMKGAEAPDGTIYVAAGSWPSNVFQLLHLEANGTPIWTHIYTVGSPAAPTGIGVRPNGRVVITSVHHIMQCAADGTVDWVHRIDDHVIRSLEFVSGTDTYYLIGATDTGAGWVMRPDTTGQVAGCVITPLTATYSVGSPAITNTCNIAQVPLDLGTSYPQTVSSMSATTSLECSSTALAGSMVLAAALIAAPNPAYGRCIVRLTCPGELRANDRIEIIDLHGRALRSIPGNGTREMLIERGDLQAGLYMVRLVRDGIPSGSVRVVWQ